ncbi:alpha/beta fold hydrolase [Streptomyces sp. NPDC058394]|uniref:alpha/beta fold hydrolase n=1 Tax=unclassified Streptomyces TaxID=2593676 RepID=UPI00365141CD
MSAIYPSVWLGFSQTSFTLQQVQVARWSTRVLTAGPADGEPLVLMHGTGGHLETYAHNVKAFVDAGYRVVAYDFPGHAGTTHATADLELPHYVEHLLGLLDALGIDRAHLSGESLGGWVAIKFAAQYPERTLKIVPNTPGGTMARPEVMEKIRTLSQAAADDPSYERVKARLEWLMADPATVTEELIATRRAHYSRPGYADSARALLCLQDPQIRRRNLITDGELAAVQSPALVIWSSDDPSGPAKAGLDMAEKMPLGSFALVENAGHWPQWEQAEVFNKLVIDFLADDSQAGERK